MATDISNGYQPFADNDLANGWRASLIIFSVISFQPQLRLGWNKKNSRGISLYHVLFSLLSATEQLSVWFAVFVSAHLPDRSAKPEEPSHPNVGGWLTLTQLFVIWLLSLARFFQCLRYPSDHQWWEKVTAGVVFGIQFLLFIEPLADDWVSHGLLHPPAPEGRGMTVAIFASVQIYGLNPIILIGLVIGIYLQSRQLANNHLTLTLSLDGLALQGALFAITTVSWHLELYDFRPDSSRSFPQALEDWYRQIGWIAMNNVIFAAGQLIQLWKMSHRWKRVGNAPGSGEIDPLLPVTNSDS